MITEEAVVRCLRNVDGLPFGNRDAVKRRTIYEAGKGARLEPSGEFFIDFAAFPGGITDPIPLPLIEDLEQRGVLIRAYRSARPACNAWVLADTAPKKGAA